MERLYAILQHRLPTNVLDYEILGYIYWSNVSVIEAGDLYTLRKQIFPFDKTDPRYTNAAVKRGDLDILEWLYNQGATFDKNIMDRAALHGHLKVLKWLAVHRPEGEHGECANGCTEWAMDWAAMNGHFKVLKFLHAYGASCTTDAMDWAAKNGHLKTLKFLHAHGAACTTYAMDEAAKNGHLKVVKWLSKHRTEGHSVYLIDEVAKYGHLQVMQWLDHIGATCSSDAICWATKNGHLEVVKWFYGKYKIERGYAYILRKAIKYNQDHIVEWLRKGLAAPYKPC